MYSANWTFLISEKNIPFVEFYRLEDSTEQARRSEERISNSVCFKWVYENVNTNLTWVQNRTL